MEADVTSVPAPPETLPSFSRLRELVVLLVILDFFVLRTFLEEEEVFEEPDLVLRVFEVRGSMAT